MPTVLITGANRGLGLEFARQYALDGWDVAVTVRQPSTELAELGVQIERLDMLDLASVANIGDKFEALDLVIANAGSMRPEKAESAEDGRAWVELLTINTIAPYLLAKALLENVAAVSGKLIAITSKMGSIADSSGGYVPYRTSKAALNMAWHSLAIEARPLGVAAAVINPGWVQTRMGGGNAPLSPQDSISQMRQVIAGLTLDRTGSFLDRDGSVIPW
jgi:NAD(P)-dependent dehydrogenase (short-subunit alcohol dehydrogenase family)